MIVSNAIHIFSQFNLTLEFGLNKSELHSKFFSDVLKIIVGQASHNEIVNRSDLFQTLQLYFQQTKFKGIEEYLMNEIHIYKN